MKLRVLAVALFLASGLASAEDCSEPTFDLSEVEQAAQSAENATLMRVVDQIEHEFSKQGIQFDAGPARLEVIRDLEKLYNYFNAQNDPGASKRMTYLLSLMKYAKFTRISGAQVRQLMDGVAAIMNRENVTTDVGNDASKAQGLFDMNQVLGVTEFIEMDRRNGKVALVLDTNCARGA